MDQRQIRIAVAEGVGTAVLLIGGPGSAVLAADVIGVLGVALAFGLSLLVMAYTIGPISGCHINPAVTLGLVLARKLPQNEALPYVIGQVVGAVVGGGVVLLVASGVDGFDANPDTFAVNGWDDLSPGGYGFLSMLVVEILLTALLVFVVLMTFHRGFAPGQVGLTVGLTLTLIHLISIPVDNTSVNPVRSLGMAVFAGGDALTQLWAFIVFPLVGGALGAVGWSYLGRDDEGADSTT